MKTPSFKDYIPLTKEEEREFYTDLETNNPVTERTVDLSRRFFSDNDQCYEMFRLGKWELAKRKASRALFSEMIENIILFIQNFFYGSCLKSTSQKFYENVYGQRSLSEKKEKVIDQLLSYLSQHPDEYFDEKQREDITRFLSSPCIKTQLSYELSKGINGFNSHDLNREELKEKIHVTISRISTLLKNDEQNINSLFIERLSEFFFSLINDHGFSEAFILNQFPLSVAKKIQGKILNQKIFLEPEKKELSLWKNISEKLMPEEEMALFHAKESLFRTCQAIEEADKSTLSTGQPFWRTFGGRYQSALLYMISENPKEGTAIFHSISQQIIDHDFNMDDVARWINLIQAINPHDRMKFLSLIKERNWIQGDNQSVLFDSIQAIYQREGIPGIDKASWIEIIKDYLQLVGGIEYLTSDIFSNLDSILKMQQERCEKAPLIEEIDFLHHIRDVESLAVNRYNEENVNNLHGSLKTIIQAIGYRGNNEGICFGYSQMAIQGILCGEIEKFSNRLDRLVELINQYGAVGVAEYLKELQINALNILRDPKVFEWEKNQAKINLEEYSDFIAFFEGVDLYFQPETYARAFPGLFEGELQLVLDPQQFYLEQLFSLLQPEPLVNRGGMNSPFLLNSSNFYSKLFVFFHALRQKSQENDLPRLAFNLVGNQHSIVVTYAKEKNSWLLIDSNLRKIQEIQFDTDLQAAIDESLFIQTEGVPKFFKVQAFCTEENSQTVYELLTSIENLL